MKFVWIALVMIALWSCKKEESPEIVLAQVSTTSVDVIGDQEATAYAVVTDNGGGSVSVRGVCWNTTGQPTTNNFYLNKGSGTGSFTLNIEGLEGGVTYYLRSFATNEAGTAYGNQMEFTTDTLQGFDYFGATIYVHPYDNVPYYVWGTGDQYLNANSLGYGAGNTVTIASSAGIFAAKVCHDLVAFGHNDWYLPAINELVAVYEHMENPEFFPNTFYWSSTEDSAEEAVALHFDTGEIQIKAKNGQYGCRCIRKQY